MRIGLLLIAVMLSRGLAFQQVANPGMTTNQTRSLTEALEMGHESPKAQSLPRTPTFEEGDDPTVKAHPVTQHDPTPAARKLAQKAEHLAHKKQHQQAIAQYRAALAIDSQYFEAWNNLGLELQAIDQNDEAEQIFRRLIVSNPEHVIVFTNLASLLATEKRYPEAESIARAAMKQHNYSFSANYVLGTVLINQGKFTDEARNKLEYAETKYTQARSLLEHWPAKTAIPN